MPELPPDIAALQMRLRSGGVVGGTKQQLSPAQRELFEEGLALVFERWTALLPGCGAAVGRPKQLRQGQRALPGRAGVVRQRPW